MHLKTVLLLLHLAYKHITHSESILYCRGGENMGCYAVTMFPTLTGAVWW